MDWTVTSQSVQKRRVTQREIERCLALLGGIESPAHGSDNKRKESTTTTEDSHELVQVKTTPYTELVDDNLIKQKIDDANLLIERVKKALGKIKGIKPVSNTAEEYIDVSNSSSTDIEQTIRKLKKQADELVKGAELISKHNALDSEEKPSDTSQTDEDYQINARLSRTTKDISCCHQKPKEEELNVNVVSDLDLRPRTRRNNTEDDLPEEYRLDKFRNIPESEQSENSSSFEALQEKLQTISEGTESTVSTPKHVIPAVMPKPKELKCCGCNTDTVGNDCKEIQVTIKKSNICLGTNIKTKNQPVQTDKVPKKYLCRENNNPMSIPPRTKKLEEKCCGGQTILPKQKSWTRCEITMLPVEEIPPVLEQKKQCSRCHKQLKEENGEGLCIKSTCPKRKHLIVQKLPPIVVRPGLTKVPVANFSITSKGNTENRLDNSENIRFVIAKHPTHEEKAGKSSLLKNPVSRSDSKLFLKIKESLLKTITAHTQQHTKQESEEDRRRKMMYQSFLIYDNPNRHLPEPLNKRSKEKMSLIDIDVYKTYINPDGWSAGPNIPDYYLSKGVQCDIPSTESETKTSKEEIMVHDIDIPEDKVDSPVVEEKLEEILPCDVEIKEKVPSKYSVGIQTSEQEPGPPTSLSTRQLSEDIGQKNLFEDMYLLDYHSESVDDTSRKMKNAEQETIKLESVSVQDKIMSIPITEEEEKIPEEASVTDLLSDRVKSVSIDVDEDLAPSEDDLLTEDKIEKRKQTDISEIYNAAATSGYKLGAETSEDNRVLMVKTFSSYSTPSEVTLTISYSNSDESSVLEQANKMQELRTTEQEIECVEYGTSRHLSEEPKMLTANKIDAINKVKEKLKTLDTSTSTPVFNLSGSATQSGETVNTFIKGLTLITTDSDNDTKTASPKVSTKKPNQNQNVNYCFVEGPSSHNSNPLELDKNGRYKDEANLFAPNISLLPTQNYKTRLGSFTSNTNYLENPRSRLLTLPKRVRRYSPEASNSDTITTLSEGEIRCKHSVSNGEMHKCHINKQYNGGRLKRNILTKTYDFCDRAKKHFNFSDQKITVEERRNHFNNWVTYYIKAQERINDSSTSSCSNNK